MKKEDVELLLMQLRHRKSQLLTEADSIENEVLRQRNSDKIRVLNEAIEKISEEWI